MRKILLLMALVVMSAGVVCADEREDARQRNRLALAERFTASKLENMLFYFFGLKDVPENVGETESDEKNLLQGLIMSAANVIYLNNYIECVRKQNQE